VPIHNFAMEKRLPDPFAADPLPSPSSPYVRLVPITGEC
jgi:hypothetical protein